MTKNCQESTEWESPKPNGESHEEPIYDPMSYEEQGQGLPIWARGLIVLGLISLLVFGLISLRSEKDTSMDLKKLNLPSQAEVSRISVSTNPAYQEKLEAYSERKAEAARYAGESFVAPISQARRRNVPKESPKEAPKEHASQPEKNKESPREKPGPSETRTPVRPKREAPKSQINPKRVQLKAQALASVLTNETFVPQGQSIYQTISKKRPEAPRQSPYEPLLIPGDILYATNCLTVSSDSPGPVMASIVSGPLKGARLLGSFVSQKEHLILTFTRLILPERLSRDKPRERTLLAYALDPKSQGLGLASDVDHHYLERFAGIFAASFLEGYGQAVQNSGVTNYNSVYGQSSHTPRYSPSDQLWIASGKVGQNLSQLMQEKTKLAPTVTLASGLDLGIVILKPDALPAIQ